MKIAIISLISLLAGVGVGWYIGHGHAKHETTEVVEQMMQTIESSDALAAATSIRAIGSIQSGDMQRAVQLLSRPIANYYYIYTNDGTNDKRSTKLRALIEQLISTNKIAADEITNQMVNYEMPGRVK